MKKLTVAAIISAMALIGVNSSYAGDIPVANPKLALEGNTVTMQCDLSSGGSGAYMQILFKGAETGGFTEFSTLQPYSDWVQGTGKNKTSIVMLYAEGWEVKQIIPYNANAAKQFYVVCVKK